MKKIILFVFGLFMMLGLASCGEAADSYKLSVVAPSGAPAVAVSTLAEKDSDSYTFVAADAIGAQFQAKELKDIIIAPINAGAVQFKNNAKYKLGAVLTWGNLYFVTKNANVNTIADFAGKNVTLFGANTINEAIAQYVLSNKNIEVNYEEAAASAAASFSKLTDDNIVLTAEPLVTTKKLNGLNIKSFSVAELYEEISGNKGFAQAGLFINVDTIANHKSVVDAYLKEVSNACKLVKTNLDQVANACVSLGLFTSVQIATQAIPNSKISYKSAKDAKAEVEATANIKLKTFGGALPVNEFYYE